MAEIDRLRAENEMLQARLSGLTEAIRHISEDLNLDTVLRRVADSARTLTGARYAAITTIDDAGELQDVLFSGLSEQQQDTLVGYGTGIELFKYLSGLRDPLRITDFVAHVDSVGFPGFQPQIGGFISAQIRGRGGQVGSIYVGKPHDDAHFTHEDEEILEVFASQAALTLVNARRYGDEQRSKADLEAFVNASPVGVLVVDVASESVVMANQEARRIARVDPEHVHVPVTSLEQLRFKRLDGSEIALDDLPFESALNNGETVHAEEIVIVHPGGSEVAALISATPIRSEDGELATVIATLQDMSPLEDMERLRAEFLAMVSHELRAPLTSIKGSAATMRSSLIPPDPAEVRQFFRIVEEQADHMRDLINDLLDMTRIEAGTLSVSPEPVDLESVVEQAKNAFLGGGHRHSVEIEHTPSLPRVWGDKQRIVQVLHNLFSNAAANSSEWSTISVSASLDGTHVAVSVTDEGTGIDPERLPLLFTKFSRGDRDDRGYGLGLAICRGIVEAHGGRIWAYSAAHGRGARFTFTVPALDEPAIVPAHDEPGDQATSSAATKVERILVVDDDLQTLRFVRSTLAKAGYTPVVTSDPSEAGNLLESEMPHLVLMDLLLPGTDAFEVIKRVPKLLEVPVIFVSGRSDDQLVAKALELGAADYIVKPFSPTELLARIAAALRRQAQSRHAEPYRLGDLTVDFLTHTAMVAGQTANLTPTEYKLLSELCINAGRALSYEQLLETVWGEGSSGDAQRVRTFIKDLRAKLGDDARNPTYILTVPNIGYQAASP
ncbi:MAG: ATP-binding protein [Acidimicrobiaceae bacterium]|nr:ATP-binding protein [Acidimicrobiaceae bacterium]